MTYLHAAHPPYIHLCKRPFYGCTGKSAMLPVPCDRSVECRPHKPAFAGELHIRVFRRCLPRLRHNSPFAAVLIPSQQQSCRSKRSISCRAGLGSTSESKGDQDPDQEGSPTSQQPVSQDPQAEDSDTSSSSTSGSQSTDWREFRCVQ